ncbi:hypothetical protein Mettu_2367 [Methylobacter tundripaludum SV96]|uniref:Uncharacterized protein n=1 Tax=Methylobacter tundripaludum (strain ATCC BAA-1195 / DSM 17260 / SV96) TaxID=697282 RepID=G3IXV2_METTV|nr:hypothetical protein Mettu_2367 [Methylobacter tundripaludum SV96]
MQEQLPRHEVFTLIFLRELRVFVVNYSICFLLIEYTDLLLKLMCVELRIHPYP